MALFVGMLGGAKGKCYAKNALRLRNKKRSADLSVDTSNWPRTPLRAEYLVGTRYQPHTAIVARMFENVKAFFASRHFCGPAGQGRVAPGLTLDRRVQ